MWFYGLIALALLGTVLGDETIDGSYITEQRGFFRREHSLVKPFQGEYALAGCGKRSALIVIL